MVPEPVTDGLQIGNGGLTADPDVRPDQAVPAEPATTIDRVGPGGGVASDSAFGVALVTLWQRSAETGAPVGFAAPVIRSEIAARAAGLLDEIKTGRLIAVAANRARRLIGVGFLRPGRGSQRHTGHIELVLLDPDHTGAGLGTLLVGRLLELATAAGLERLDVQVPAGEGLDDFFGTLGFTEWGRRPQWVRMAPGDDRDDILLGVTVGAVR